ncbi:pyrroline-5-carboxylate reductase [Teredinibacter turnerae]|uniref:pyrroline-5-carboxylate reductase n=1 Tax=Teredinibacter turnerae TaxID=2426 RepID=UPI0005F7C9FC|nr:pyrroline-5-carboxylate reductase [Teredinibacter turnerae]
MTDSQPIVAFIGAGNMAGSIFGGLVANGYSTQSIIASDPKPEALAKLQASLNIRTTTDNREALAAADIVVLAVKPQVMKAVCCDLAPHLKPGTLVVSIAAGISAASLHTWLGGSQDLALVRCMPNTPSLVQAGASGLFATPSVSDKQKQQAESIMAAVGSVCWVNDEEDIHAVTAVSGSGPAYFFLMIEAMIDAGVAQGLSKDTAARLALDTAYGAAKLAVNSDVDVVELRRRVTSPNGTTAEAIASFENNNYREIVADAMRACADRSRQLAEQLAD